jgi:hypothetical protein
MKHYIKQLLEQIGKKVSVSQFLEQYLGKIMKHVLLAILK